MKESEIENIEIKLLLEAIFLCYGYDFRHYAHASLKRRIKNFLAKSGHSCISELLPDILYNRDFLGSLLYNISVTVTEMFRDPWVYQYIREQVLASLVKFPYVKIWHAGCATGEEVYSMAIMLKEEGIYDRCQIYATDFNDRALARARDGIFSIDRIKEHTGNYQKAGGMCSFSDYYHSEYGSAIINRDLKENITFANHNLATDSVFGEMHFIICRNVLIYFDKTLQNRVLNLFYNSLVPDGFLCLGTKESTHFSDVANKFYELNKTNKIYRLKSSESR
ncbi:MAG: protein-glutamate O-methyltransferase CheR [bacterium]|nr:protein-glutamate O-methyltransferase CheR [bacterium]